MSEQQATLDQSGDERMPPETGSLTGASEIPSNVVDGETHRDRWLESISVALLAITTLIAAWCGYQAALWGGQQSANYTQAGAQRVESVRANTVANQRIQIDIALFMNWLNASMEDNADLAALYESRFTPAMTPAFDAWIDTDPFNNPDAPNSPFGMPEYVQPELEESDRLEAEAEDLFEEGQAANKESDSYVLTTVFLATTLFFLAVSTRIKWFNARVTLAGIASGMLVVAVAYITTLGIAS